MKATAAPRLAVVVCAVASVLVGCSSGGSTTSTATQASPTEFNADAAWALIEDQVDVGQRPAGSPQLQKLADYLRRRLPNGQFEPVDTKKKELIGDFKNAGREWRPKGDPEKVRTHDFKDKDLGKVNPYGVYDIAQDAGWVSVGIDNDTAQFAVASICGWWEHLGRTRYPQAKTLTITADCGGSNGNRTRLWKTELQRLANATGLKIGVCHFPPGTSKWNKIEHRLFSFISMNWRAKPLVSRQSVIDLIAATSTRTGLEVFARLDERTYPKAIKVSDIELAGVKLQGNTFHPEWNYAIKPSANS